MGCNIEEDASCLCFRPDIIPIWKEDVTKCLRFNCEQAEKVTSLALIDETCVKFNGLRGGGNPNSTLVDGTEGAQQGANGSEGQNATLVDGTKGAQQSANRTVSGFKNLSMNTTFTNRTLRVRLHHHSHPERHKVHRMHNIQPPKVQATAASPQVPKPA